MALETPTFISDLVVTNPAHSDGLNQADAHLRGIKAALRNTFPNINGAVTPSDEDLTLLLNAAASGLLAVLADGTSTAPSLNFKSEPTLGLYRSAAKTLSIAGGALRGNGAVKPGSIHMFVVEPSTLGKGGTGTGHEYLELDGSTWNIADFPALAQALGVTTGTQFALPRLTDTGRFPRSRTAALAAGTLQANTVGPHVHPDFNGTSATESTAHTHNFSGTTGSMDRNVNHSHAETGFTGGTWPGYGGSQGAGGGGPFGFATNSTTGGVNLDHLHNFSGTTATENQFHAHTFSVNIAANTGTTETRPEAFSFIFAIKT